MDFKGIKQEIVTEARRLRSLNPASTISQRPANDDFGILAPHLRVGRQRENIFKLIKQDIYKLPVIGNFLKTLILLAKLPLRFEQIFDEIRYLNHNVNKNINDINELRDGAHDMQTRFDARLDHLRQQFEHMIDFETKVIESVTSLRTKVAEQILAADRLTTQVETKLQSGSFAGDRSKTQSAPNSNENSFSADGYDEFYLKFEEEFRGSTDLISERQKFYIPFLQRSGIDWKQFPVLDIGSGRGEWLSLLQREGIAGKGVDLSESLAADARVRGVEVVVADAFDYISRLPAESLGAVSVFHVVEHLPFKVLMRLLAESYRVLRKDGVLILETPNPENILVGSCQFYTDPTHIKPIPPVTLQFMVKYQQFTNACIYRHARMRPPSDSLGNKDLDDLINRAFMEQDYAIIAQKGTGL